MTNFGLIFSKPRGSHTTKTRLWKDLVDTSSHRRIASRLDLGNISSHRRRCRKIYLPNSPEGACYHLIMLSSYSYDFNAAVYGIPGTRQRRHSSIYGKLDETRRSVLTMLTMSMLNPLRDGKKANKANLIPGARRECTASRITAVPEG